MTRSPATPKGERSRSRIVDAAADLVHARGVAATRLDDVLAASGAGKSQLYHYFDGRTELVAAVIDAQAARILAGQAALLEHARTCADLRAWADAVVAHQDATHGEGGCPLGSLAAALSDRSEAYRAQLVAGFDRWQDLFEVTLGRLRTAGELGAHVRPREDAGVLLTTLQGGLLMTQTTRDVRHLRTALDHALASFAP